MLNLDRGIFKVNEFFETQEQRDVVGPKSPSAGDQLFSGMRCLLNT